jgi:hypothetical protein
MFRDLLALQQPRRERLVRDAAVQRYDLGDSNLGDGGRLVLGEERCTHFVEGENSTVLELDRVAVALDNCVWLIEFHWIPRLVELHWIPIRSIIAPDISFITSLVATVLLHARK